MSKSIKSLISVLAFTIGIALLVLFVYNQSAKNKGMAMANGDMVNGIDNSSLELDESEYFYSLEEYEAYLCANAENDTAAKYYYPERLPEDVSLILIKVNEEGTIFYFNVPRDVETLPSVTDDLNDLNIIECTASDTTLNALLNTIVVKVFGSNYSFISNRREYAGCLAEDLGAELVYSDINFDSYKGKLYTYNGFSFGSVVEVGTQQVDWINMHIGSSNIQYTYTPVSLTESEVLQITHLVERTAESDNN